MAQYRCPRCEKDFQAASAGIYRCPHCSQEISIEEQLELTAWDAEQKGNWIAAFWKTLTDSLKEPHSFFKSVAMGNGFWRPWFYATLVTSLGVIAVVAFQAGLGFVPLGQEWMREFGASQLSWLPITYSFSIGMAILMGLIAFPVATLVGLLVQSCLYHLGLIILGAAKRPLVDTFRVVCYASGPQVFQIVPLVGSMISAIWCLVLNIIGLKTVHGTTTAKALFAVLLPILLCCSFLLLAGGLFAGGIVGALLGRFS